MTVANQPIRFENSRLNRIADWMQSYVDSRKYPGCSTLIHNDGSEAWFHAIGLRNVEEHLPFTRDTVVRIYSMTKPVTSVALLMQMEQGLFHLDAPVSEFIPEFSDCTVLIPNAQRLDQTEPCAVPTLHQLLTHTSGLSYSFNPGLLPGAYEAQELDFNPGQGALADMVAKVAGLPLAFRPGSKWEYSVGIDIIGRVIEVVAGKPLGQVFAETLFEPLGMTETGFQTPSGAGDRFASLYTPLAGDAMVPGNTEQSNNPLYRSDDYTRSSFHRTGMHSGGGGLLGTIDDYMRFAEMLRCGGTAGSERLLSPRTVDFMMRNHLPGDIASMGPSSFAEQPMEGVGFGLGGAVVLDPARARCPGNVGDFSWGGMASTFFWIDRVLDLSVVFFTQLLPSSTYPSRAQLKALVHGAVLS
ncbi:MAG: beta-lactamase family protein [Rhodobacteraceae bacterium]|nr:beta-lactamase family protein [Paracoccaceae bacterium]